MGRVQPATLVLKLLPFNLYSGTPLTLADLHQVHTKLYEARTNWFEIGQCLAVDNETLRSIRGDCKFRDDGARLNEMLDCRLKSKDHLTWATLCDCLRDPTVARDDVANKILKGELSIIICLATVHCRHC